MLQGLPGYALDIMDWDWPRFEPYAADLAGRELTAATVEEWLTDWTRLTDLLHERYSRLYNATQLNTTDEAAREAFMAFLDTIYPRAKEMEQKLREKLLASGLEPAGFAIPLRNMRAEADLYREENIPLLTEHQKLGLNYDRIISGQTIQWDGQEVTPAQLVPLVQNADRATRERAWRQMSARVLADRQAINDNWRKLMAVRRQIAANAGKSDYRAYAWQEKLRFDYTPDDAATFHAAIETAVVPATARVYERRRRRYGIDSLRPWDVGVDVMRSTDVSGDPLNRPPIAPFSTVDELEDKGAAVFHQVDPVLGEHFEIMRRERLLDLANYKGKAPGAYCMPLPSIQRPWVLMNAVGRPSDVDTLLHEIGHAFHEFEGYTGGKLPYYQLRDSPMEFNEVASMAMELLASPYLTHDHGGFYTPEEAARVMVEHLEGMLIFWPYMAVVDAFNHWAHTHEAGDDPAACDAKWGDLWDRFIVGVDWSGLEDEKVTGWHRKLHIHRVPFYYIEYGLAQLGAVQVWRNALSDQAGAVAAYRHALSLGGSVTLPELYRAAGATFAFDAAPLGEAVALIEHTIERLETAMGLS